MKENLKSVESLKELLADQFVIYTKLLNYHWNVNGINFYRLHSLFEQLYSELAEEIDEIAERIKILGYVAPGSLQEFLALSKVKESNQYPIEDTQMVKDIIADYEYLKLKIESIIENKTDIVSEGMLVSILEKYEKHVWMMKSTVK